MDDRAPAAPASVQRFLVRGMLDVLPRRHEDRDRVFRYLASRTLPVHDPVGERELTERLDRLTHDPVGMRRALADAGPVTRTRDGAEYWRTRVTEFDDL